MSSDAPLRSGRLQRDYVISQACVRLAGFLQRARDQNDEPMEATYRDCKHGNLPCQSFFIHLESHSIIVNAVKYSFGLLKFPYNHFMVKFTT